MRIYLKFFKNELAICKSFSIIPQKLLGCLFPAPNVEQRMEADSTVAALLNRPDKIRDNVGRLHEVQRGGHLVRILIIILSQVDFTSNPFICVVTLAAAGIPY
jgi:hypothetical protein